MSIREELRAFFTDQRATAAGSYPRSPAAFYIRPGGEDAVPPDSRVRKLLNTILFVGLFVLICRLMAVIFAGGWIPV